MAANVHLIDQNWDYYDIRASLACKVSREPLPAMPTHLPSTNNHSPIFYFCDMHYYYTHEIVDDVAVLSDSEVQHIIKSMRMHDGDEIWILDGEGSKMRCRLQIKGKKEVKAVIQERITEPTGKARLHLAIAPTKNPGRLEWMVEKATELGVGQITFLQTRRSERTKINLDRIRKIAISALKQSGNLHLPSIASLTSLDHLFRLSSLPTQLFIAHCQAEDLPHLSQILQTDQEAVVMIGPEGDFTPDEIEAAILAGFRPISLGKLRLRTETAGIFVTSMVAILNKF